VLVLLVVVAVFMLWRRPTGTPQPRSASWAMLVAGAIGAYDGFFGPGTGTFLIAAYAWLWGETLTAASANAKVVNFASNLAALLGFTVSGMVLWPVALPMAAGQLVGGWCGAHVTIRRGDRWVRQFVIAVSVALVIRLAWQWWTR